MSDLTGIAEAFEGLATRIAGARRARSWRQSDLAEHAGCSRSSIQALESGNQKIGVDIVLRVLWALGLLETLDFVANPALDEGAMQLSPLKAGVRVRLSSKGAGNDF